MDRHTTSNLASRTNRKGLIAIVLAATFLLSFVWTVQAAGPPGELEPVCTAAANARTNAGACGHISATAYCQEICLRTMGGQLIPQGTFICVDD